MTSRYAALFLVVGLAFAGCGDDSSDDDTSTEESSTQGGDGGHGDAGRTNVDIDAGARDGGRGRGSDDDDDDDDGFGRRGDGGRRRRDGGFREGGSDASSVSDAGGLDAGAGAVVSSNGTWTIFSDPYADGGANPAGSITGGAVATRTDAGGIEVVLTVSGLPANRAFGAHLHKLACSDANAGGHYQDMPAPADAGTDPAYANASNELWLDFTTDANGAAETTAQVAWVPRAGEAKAIVVHAHQTGSGGAAGSKLACTELAF